MSKPSNTLYKTLQEFPRKRITLEELSGLCLNPEQLSEQVIALTDQGVLVPVKSSGTNGNQKSPLFMRYTINKEMHKYRLMRSMRFTQDLQQTDTCFVIKCDLSITEIFCAG